MTKMADSKQAVTRAEAWRLLSDHYSAATIDDDPEWAEEMVEALMDRSITLPWTEDQS